MKNVRDWMIEWFSEKGKIDKAEVEKIVYDNYVESGLIDSFGFIELISMVEERFNVTFTDEEFESESLLTINGIISIVESRVENEE